MEKHSSRYVSVATWSLLIALLAVGVVATPLVAQEGSQIESEITVTDDGAVESIHLEQELPAEIAELLSVLAEDEGYDSFPEYAAADIVEQTDGIGDYEAVDGTEDGEWYVMELTLTDVDADELAAMDVSAEDETVAFEMTGGDEPPYDGDEAIFTDVNEYTVTVELPGEVTESNAATTDGSTATWNLQDDSPDQLTAESGGSSDGGDSGDGLPGFGPAVAIAGLLLATLSLARRQG